MGSFDIRLLLAGIGILLFGMNVFEEGIKELAGKKMKFYLEKYTRGAWRSITTGSFVTGVLQSSSLVSLLLLGFVGAGIMALPNAIGVIIGANIGTTLDALYVSLLGFGEFSISAFAMPIIAIGGILLLTSGKSEKRLLFGKLFVGFGLLFIGIDFMKDSVEQLKASIDLAQYADMSLRGFALLGVVVTMVIQSSSATSVLTFTALASGLIGFEASVAIVFGANLGTTVTPVIASLGGSVSKRQLALSHVAFNVAGLILAALLFHYYIAAAGLFVSIENDPVFANAVTNTIFNLSVALLFAPMIKPFSKWIQKILPNEQQSTVQLTTENFSLPLDKDNTSLTIPLLLKAAQDDTKLLMRQTMDYNTNLRGLDHESLESSDFDIAALQKDIKPFDNNAHRALYESNQDIADKLLPFLDEIEKMEDGHDINKGNSPFEQAIVSCIGSMKHIKNIRHNLQALRTSSSSGMTQLYETLWNSTALLYRQLTTVASRNFTTDNITEIDDAMKKIQSLYADNIGELTSLGQTAGEEELDSSSLVNTTRELYDSAKRMVEAISILYLSKEERKMLTKIL